METSLTVHFNCRRFTSLQYLHVCKSPRCVTPFWFDNIQEHINEFKHYLNNSFRFWPRRYSFHSAHCWWGKVNLQRMFRFRALFTQVIIVLPLGSDQAFSAFHKKIEPSFYVNVCLSTCAIPMQRNAWSAVLCFDGTYLHCSTLQCWCIWRDSISYENFEPFGVILNIS